MNIHFIAPYEAMTSIINECIPLFPELSIGVSVGDLQNGVEIALEAENQGADMIISRGGTSKLIKQAVKIPVIDMQVSGYDLMRTLTLASNLTRKTAIVGFPNITSGAKSIIELMDLQLSVYTIQSAEEVAPLIIELKNKGYEQIVGDVITYKTSIAYGLKGFLIHSGKESIIQVIEDSKQLYFYINQHQHIHIIFEHLLLERYSNLLILNGKHQIIYEKLTHFKSNPLTDDHLYLLKSDLEVNQHQIMTKLIMNDSLVDVIGNSFVIENETFYVYILEKNQSNPYPKRGITLYPENRNEPFIPISSVMQHIINSIEKLYQKGELICLIGAKGTGKDFISTYIHQKYEKESILLTIDFEDFNLNEFVNLSLKNVRTIKLKNLHLIEQHQLFEQFIEKCIQLDIHIFILTEQHLTSSLFIEDKMSKIIIPPLSERKEDIVRFVHYFISYFHEQYGTNAVKIKNDALSLLENHEYPINISSLKKMIKEILLNEQDYVIHLDTIKKLLDQNIFGFNTFHFQGTLKEIEKQIIQTVLKEENHNQSKTAERLGINRATLWRKLKE